MTAETGFSLITQVEDLPPALAASVGPQERAYIASLAENGGLPFAVTPHYASLAGTEADDPIRRQCIPDPREGLRTAAELDDPLGEACHRRGPRFVHQYSDRILLLAVGTCAGYCRHCFRRVWTGEAHGFIGPQELDAVSEYLRRHPEVREVLISGGDPLVASNERLERLFAVLRVTRPGILLRLGSRIPIVHPERLDEPLTALLREYRPLRLVVHVNHPRELAPEVRSALGALIDAGLQLHTQTVLLRGINDCAELLAELFRNILDLGATPYYLFQGDLAPGTSHLRVPLTEGLALYRRLGTLISGLGLPAYVVDLPGGGGKIALHDGVIVGRELDDAGNPYHLLQGRDGRLWRYPEEM